MSGLKGTPQARASERRIIHRAANPSPYTSPTASDQARSSHDGYEFGQSLSHESHESGAGSPESRARRGGRGEARGVDGRAGGGEGALRPPRQLLPRQMPTPPLPMPPLPLLPPLPLPPLRPVARPPARGTRRR